MTPGHLSSNPRIVKEADALAESGYEVHVVHGRSFEWGDEADRDFVARPWRSYKVAFGPMAGRFRHFVQSIRRRAAWLAYRRWGAFAELAYHAAIPALARAACAIPADLYIAHNLAALPAASAAARVHGAKLGFDAEDFHSGELADIPENASLVKLTRDIERRYLPSCNYLTAASPGIARAYAEACGVRQPVVILNVFSRAEAPPEATPRGSAKPSPSLYWFSQTIGPGRGLETVIEALALSRSRPTLFLRGHPAPRYAQHLVGNAKQLGIFDQIRMLPPARPQEMIRLASEYDVGIASEPGNPTNNNLAISNKIFCYLLSGIPVVASDTMGQVEFSRRVGFPIFLYRRDCPRSLAAAIDHLLENPQRLLIARRAALETARSRYCWEYEKTVFISLIGETLKGEPDLAQS